jgi:hypothetical protein
MEGEMDRRAIPVSKTGGTSRSPGQDRRPPPPKNVKVFCCGLPRTGTRSLCAGLQTLGLKTVHAKHTANLGWWDADAFADTPVWCDYKILDQRFKDAKFILSIRQPEAWFKSFHDTLGKLYRYVRKIKPGDRAWDHIDRRTYQTVFKGRPLEPDFMIPLFKEHNQRVREYFKDRPGKLIEINVATPGALAVVARFLDLEPLNFPNVNKISKVTVR